MDSDEKKIKSIMVEALKEIVVPRLEKIETKLGDHDEKFESIDKQFVRVNEKFDVTMEMVAKNSEDITMLREDFTDMGYTVERIETKLDSTVRRTLRLETKVKKI